MSSLYIHIPFCKQACYYCDFHFSTNLQLKDSLIEALCKEIFLQKDYLHNKHLHTIYLGGGTPSLLQEKDLYKIFDTIQQYFFLDKDIEITLEANPDDLTIQKLQMFKRIGINRLSIGIQSFSDVHLQYLHRVHCSKEAKDAVIQAKNIGIDNISIDLIYAIPASDHSIWEQDLQEAIKLDVNHISAYCLTIEEKTVFGNWLKNNKILPIPDDFAIQQFNRLVEFLAIHSYEQYEISNFAKNQNYSKHNSNYWKKDNYLGIGPSAHSYNGVSRQFNTAHNMNYIKHIQNNYVPYEKEILSTINQINEYIMTSLRTKWGCNLIQIQGKYSIDILQTHQTYIFECIQKKLLYLEKDVLYLTNKGKLFADKIAADLFLHQ